MGEPNDEPGDEVLLRALIETLPVAATPEQHQDNVASLLRHFVDVHRRYGASLPGWLELGLRRYGLEAQDPPPD